jgi:hypothetical protein
MTHIMLATDVNNHHRRTVTPKASTGILVCIAGQTGAHPRNRDAQGFEDHARDVAVDRFIHDPALSSRECQISLKIDDKKQKERSPEQGKAGVTR